MKLNRSTYYKIKNHKPSKREKFNKYLQDKITEIYNDSKQRYGAPKIHRELKRQRINVSLKRVQRHMNKLKIYSIVVKKYKPQKSKATVDTEGKENLLKQDFETETINQKWCSDITYIYTLDNGWTYLASVMDLHTEKIIGYAYGKRIDSKLTLKALKNACLNVKDTKGIILHTDLGTQYTSIKFNQYLKQKGIFHSYSAKGNPYDNACIESFHSILKKEEVNINKYYSYRHAKQELFKFIVSWYNRKRIHSSLDYITPQEAENICLTKTKVS